MEESAEKTEAGKKPRGGWDLGRLCEDRSQPGDGRGSLEWNGVTEHCGGKGVYGSGLGGRSRRGLPRFDETDLQVVVVEDGIPAIGRGESICLRARGGA